MAALILGAGALLSERLREHHHKRNQNKREYASRFEEFKAENERRELQRQSYNQGIPQTVPSSNPPGYDTVTSPANNEDSRRTDSPSMSPRSRGRSGANSNGAARGQNNHTTSAKTAQAATATARTGAVS